MTRVTRAALHLSLEEVKNRLKTDPRTFCRQRWLIIYNVLVEPRKAEEIARLCGVSTATVHDVISSERVQTMYQASGYFERNAPSVFADVSEVDDQFATEPSTAVKPAEQQVSEEELLRFFEQALSDRMQAISGCSNRVSGSLTQQPYTTGDARNTWSVDGVPSTVSLRTRGGAGMWSSLPGHRWQRSIILASLALLLLLSGFDLMGVLVLLMR
jgi:hypothetical protein